MMEYIDLMTLGGVTISFAFPAMNSDRVLSVYLGCKIRITNSNNDDVSVDLFAFKTGMTTDDAFAATSSILSANSVAYIDYSRPMIEFIENNTPTEIVKISATVINCTTLATTTATDSIDVRNRDVSSKIEGIVVPGKLQLLAGAMSYISLMNNSQHAATMVIMEGSVTRVVPFQPGFFGTRLVDSSIIRSISVSHGGVRSTIPLFIVGECGRYIQLEWKSKRDGCLRSYAFKIANIGCQVEDNMDVNRYGGTMYLVRSSETYQLILPSCDRDTWHYISDINGSDYVTALGDGGSGLVPMYRCRLSQPIGDMTTTANQDIVFAINIEKEVDRW